MRNMVRKAGLAIALGATALATTAPADAQRYGGYRGGGYHGGGYHRGGIGAGGAAVLGGLVGLGVGAAIASNNRPYYGGGYGYYGPGPRYGYYNGYYNGGYYAPRCWNQWRFDPYWGRNVRVRVCD